GTRPRSISISSIPSAPCASIQATIHRGTTARRAAISPAAGIVCPAPSVTGQNREMVEAGERSLERDGHRPAWSLCAGLYRKQREDDLDLAGGVCGGDDDAGFRDASGKDRRPFRGVGGPGHDERGGAPDPPDEDPGASNGID